MPQDEAMLNELAEFFKVFGDATRIRILFALAAAEMCVCDIAALLGMNHSAISHQLKILSRSKLVRQRREGKLVYYSLSDAHVKRVLAQGFEHISE